jgi:hypothetical protein
MKKISKIKLPETEDVGWETRHAVYLANKIADKVNEIIERINDFQESDKPRV